jgi:peptidoglycan/LPS O-acetylase OafA/YrhL
VFFVLSGFLITAILTREIDSDAYYKTFYIRRIIRIFPLYYVVLLIVIGMAIAQGDSLGDMWAYFFYLQNIKLGLSNFNTHFPRSFDHSWSLAVEEQFYLAFPFFVRIFSGFLSVALAGLVLIGAAFLLTLSFYYSGSDIVWTNPVTNLIFLAAGGFLSTQREKWKALLMMIPFCVLSYFTIASTKLPISLRDPNGLLFLVATLPWICLLLLLLIAIRSKSIQLVFNNRVISYFGRISYGIYIYHYPVFVFCDQHSIGWVYKFAITIGISILSWELFERRILSLKDRFSYQDEKKYAKEQIVL